MTKPKAFSAEEKAERLLRAIRPAVARAIEANSIRGGAKLGGKRPRVVRRMRVRPRRTKRGPVRCGRERLYLPDLPVGLLPGS